MNCTADAGSVERPLCLEHADKTPKPPDIPVQSSAGPYGLI